MNRLGWVLALRSLHKLHPRWMVLGYGFWILWHKKLKICHVVVQSRFFVDCFDVNSKQGLKSRILRLTHSLYYYSLVKLGLIVKV